MIARHHVLLVIPFVAAIALCAFVAACVNEREIDPAVQCPRAVKLGIQGPGIVPCYVLETRDRRDEFVRTHQLTASCQGDTYLTCSAMTRAGTPVKFKCDRLSGCEWVPQWAW